MAAREEMPLNISTTSVARAAVPYPQLKCGEVSLHPRQKFLRLVVKPRSLQASVESVPESKEVASGVVARVPVPVVNFPETVVKTKRQAAELHKERINFKPLAVSGARTHA